MRILLTSLLALALFGVGMPLETQAAPAITTVTGTISPDSVLTITGTGFGAKSPAPPILWDTVANQAAYSGLTHGQTIPVGGGNPWEKNGQDAYTDSVKYWTSDERVSGRPIYHAYDRGELHGWEYGWTSHPKLFVNWYLRATDDGTDNSHEFKMVRLWSDGGGTDGRISWACCGTEYSHWEADSLVYTGNLLPDYPNWLGVKGEWNNLEIMVDNVGHEYPGNAYYRMATNGVKVFDRRDRLECTSPCQHPPPIGTCCGLGSVDPFDRVWVIGMESHVPVDTTLEGSWGDIYIDSTLARVVIANAPAWSGITHPEMQPPLTWSATSITATCNRGSFVAGQKVYAYVVNADSTVNLSGKEIYFDVPSGDDLYPPTYITDLASTDSTENTITLTWTAPGDDGDIGTATTYDVRYATSPISEATWDMATEVAGEPVPDEAGETETMVVTGLTWERTYYFAIKTSDEVPNESAISNTVSGTTGPRALEKIESVPWPLDDAGVTYYLDEDLFRDSTVTATALAVTASDITILGHGYTITCDTTLQSNTGCGLAIANGCDNITVRDLTIIMEGATYGGNVLSVGTGDNLLFDSCRFLSAKSGSKVSGIGNARFVNCLFYAGGTSSIGFLISDFPSDKVVQLVNCSAIGVGSALSAELHATSGYVWLHNVLGWRTLNNGQVMDFQRQGWTPLWNKLTLTYGHYKNAVDGASLVEYNGVVYSTNTGGTWIGNLDPQASWGDPKLVDATPSLTANYHPLTASPLKDTGHNFDISGFFTDADQHSRLSGLIVDKGAFEFDQGEETGACCQEEVCYLINEASCDNGGGTYGGDETDCDPNPCEAEGPNGACCDTYGYCRVTKSYNCLPTETWHERWTSCSPNPCQQPPGACCDCKGWCAVTTYADCASPNQWMGAFTTCNPNDCDQTDAIRACCTEAEGCQLLTLAACDDITGVWLCNSVKCSPSPCFLDYGACCDYYNACAVMLEDACDRGTYKGDGTVCDPNPCGVQPPGLLGGCCSDDGSCRAVIEQNCVDGVWYSGAVCSPNPCALAPNIPTVGGGAVKKGSGVHGIWVWK